MIDRYFYLFCVVSAASACLLEDGRSAVYLNVHEDLKVGELVGHLPIIGSASGDNSSIELRVVKGKDLVDIAPGTKDLKLKEQLDRDEGLSKFEAVIECKSKTAMDSEFAQLNISVFVSVLDVNDNAPVFDQSEYHVNIAEELPVGTIVFTDFEATDKDQPGPNSFVQYAIKNSTYSHLLAIEDPFRPVVTVAERIDYEKLHNFTVELEARDQGEPSQSSTAKLHVTVDDMNDNAPVFEHRYYTAKSIQDHVLQMEPAGIKATDGDKLNADISYELEGELSDQFTIDQQGVIRAKSLPPPKQAVFFVHAIESDSLNRTATAVVRVQLGSTLAFEQQTYSARILSTLPPDTVIAHITAISDSKAPIRYTVDDASAAIAVHPASGEVRLLRIPEGDHAEYRVTATDGVQSAHSLIHLSVERLDRAGPRFDRKNYTYSIGDSALIGRVRASGEGVTYTLMNMQGHFSLDSKTGTLRLLPSAAPLCSVCEVVVAAEDEHGNMAVATVSVRNPLPAVSMSSLLTMLCLVVLAVLFALLLTLVCRKMNYLWRTSKRQNICWLNKTPDAGVTVTGTMPAPSRYIIDTSEKKPVPVLTSSTPSTPITAHGASVAARSPAPPRASGAHLVPVTVTNADGAPTVYF